VKTVWLYQAKVGVGFFGAMAAAMTGLSLAYTVGSGVLAGLVSSSKPFLRTPKCESVAPWTRALRLVASEAILLFMLLGAIISMSVVSQLEDPAERVWVAALIVMAIPYAAAVVVAVGSTIQLSRRPIPQREPESVFQENKLDIAA
jgi:hypothetical protein